MMNKIFGALAGAFWGLLVSLFITFIIRFIFGESPTVNLISWAIMIFWILGGAHSGFTNDKDT